MPMPLPVAVMVIDRLTSWNFTRNIDPQNVFNRISQAAEMTARRMCMGCAGVQREGRA